MTDDADEESIYDRMGGAEGIAHLVDAFYDLMDSLPEAKHVRSLHSESLDGSRAILKKYLSEWTGGPALYTLEKGHPRLRQRHLRIPIGEEERDDWLHCMRIALNQTVADRSTRQELWGAMQRLADWMRNRPGNPHDRPGATHAKTTLH